MAKRNTLNDLSQFLEKNQEIEEKNTPVDFFEKEPSTFIKVEKVGDKKAEDILNTTKLNLTSKQIADYIHSKAKAENKSFAEIWLDILEAGAKKDVLIPFDKAFRTWMSIPGRSASILKESTLTLLFK